MAVEKDFATAIFAPIFAESWAELPPVFRAHYANRPYSNDVTIVRGTMNVWLSFPVRLVAPLLRLTGTLVPRVGKEVAVTVKFCSETDSNVFRFEREFVFPDGQSHCFISRMQPVGCNQVVEWTDSGIGWHAAYSYREGKVSLNHLGYRLRLFGRVFRLPSRWLFGEAGAHETVIDEKSFSMRMQIRHPLFGELYCYGGRFELVREQA
jgi:hypothetical protein